MISLGKIPLSIQPVFWVTAALFAYLSVGGILGTCIWAGAIFVSILGHEMGHALAAQAFRLRPSIELTAFGGVTYHRPSSSKLKELCIVSAGPLAGAILYVSASVFLKTSLALNPLSFQFFQAMRWVNFSWTILNLIPVLPLDGGQVLRLLLQGVFPRKGFYYALVCSALLGFLAAGFFLLQQQYFPGIFFLYLSYQSFALFQGARE